MLNVVTSTREKRYRQDDPTLDAVRDVRQRLFTESKKVSGGAVTKVKRSGRVPSAAMLPLVKDAFVSRLLGHWSPIYQTEGYALFGTARWFKLETLCNGAATTYSQPGNVFTADVSAAWDVMAFNNSTVVIGHGDTTVALAKASAFADRGNYLNAAIIHGWSICTHISNLSNTRCVVWCWEYRPRFAHSQMLSTLFEADIAMYSYRRGGTDTAYAPGQLDFDYDVIYNMRDSAARKYWRRVKKTKVVLDAAGACEMVTGIAPGMYSFSDLFPKQSAMASNVTTTDLAEAYHPNYIWTFFQTQGAEAAYDMRANAPKNGVGLCASTVAIQQIRQCALRVLPPNRPTEHVGRVLPETFGITDSRVFLDETDAFGPQTIIGPTA